MGAVATQAAGVASYGPEVLALLEEGLGPAEALERALADDPGREARQLGAVAGRRRSAAHTGSNAWRGRATGPARATPSRGTSSPARPSSPRWSGRSWRRRVARRALVAALEAGQAAGGDARGQQSAAVVVERSGAAAESARGRPRLPSCTSKTTRADRRAPAAARDPPRLGRAAARDRLPRAGPVRARARRCSGPRWTPRRRRRAPLRPRVLRVARRGHRAGGRAHRAGRSSSTRACGRAPRPTPTSGRSAGRLFRRC